MWVLSDDTPVVSARGSGSDVCWLTQSYILATLAGLLVFPFFFASLRAHLTRGDINLFCLPCEEFSGVSKGAVWSFLNASNAPPQKRHVDPKFQADPLTQKTSVAQQAYRYSAKYQVLTTDHEQHDMDFEHDKHKMYAFWTFDFIEPQLIEHHPFTQYKGHVAASSAGKMVLVANDFAKPVMKLAIAAANVFSKGNAVIVLSLTSFCCLVNAVLSACYGYPIYKSAKVNRVRFAIYATLCLFSLSALAVARISNDGAHSAEIVRCFLSYSCIFFFTILKRKRKMNVEGRAGCRGTGPIFRSDCSFPCV
jgi:hypothetical protein